MVKQKQRLTGSDLESSEDFFGLEVGIQFFWSVNDGLQTNHLILLRLGIISDLLHHVGVPIIIIKHMVITISQVVSLRLVPSLVRRNLRHFALHQLMLVFGYLVGLLLLLLGGLLLVDDLNPHSL